jgi:hypothetical protein
VKAKKHRSSLSSKYGGVSWHKSGNTWAAAIRYGGKKHYLGCFEDEEAAARAYDTAALARILSGAGIQGGYAALNFGFYLALDAYSRAHVCTNVLLQIGANLLACIGAIHPTAHTDITRRAPAADNEGTRNEGSPSLPRGLLRLNSTLLFIILSLVDRIDDSTSPGAEDYYTREFFFATHPPRENKG